MSVSVSIVSYNTKDLLERCLKALKNQKLVEKLNVWVLDNASKDNSAEMVEEKFPEVKLIKSEKNLGFAKGQNRILEKIDDKYVIILNPDTDFENDFTEKMVKFMEENQDCAVSGGKLTDFNGRLESNGGDFPFEASLFNWLFKLNKKPNFHRMNRDYYEYTHTVDWLSGTMMIVRTDFFKKAGYLNEKFFMYFEDAEFCYRVKKSGGKIMLNPEVVIKHKSGSSSKNPRFTQWKGEFSGLIKFYSLYRGFLGAQYARILVYLAIIFRMAAFLISGKVDKSLTYARVLVSI